MRALEPRPAGTLPCHHDLRTRAPTPQPACFSMSETPALPQGIAFTLEGVDELSFVRVLNDLMHDRAFGRPLQIQAQEPRAGGTAQLILVFSPQDRPAALNAMQRLKTILLRHGVQVDSVHVPGTD